MPRITFDITNVDDLHNQISAFFKTNAAIDQVGVPEALEVSEPVVQTPKKKAKKKAKKSKKAVPTKDDIQSSLQRYSIFTSDSDRDAQSFRSQRYFKGF